MTQTSAAAPPLRFEDADMSVAWILGAEALPGHVDPDRVALRWDEHERTYAQLRERALALAGSLRRAGLQRGDRVVGHLLNRGETFELYFACAYAGLTFVSVNWRLTAHELSLILDDCAPAHAFTQEEVAEPLRAVAGERGVPVTTLADDASGAAYDALATAEPIAGPLERTDTQVILYTSGTTGRPKGVMLDHRNITWFAFQQTTMYPGLDASARLLVTAPTFNTAGINETSIPTFLAGGTVAIHPTGGWTPRKMAALIDRWAITHTIVFPSMMEPLLEADREQPIELASLRFVLTGGENCPPATMQRFRERWPHVELAIGYGATESGVVTLIRGEEIARHPGSCGRVAPGMALRLLDGEGRPVGLGEVGELWVAGGSIVPGYWNAPELTASTLRDGWLNSGDLGRQDEHGHLYLEGRTKDLIISKGQNIYPAEIENVLSDHDALLEWTVVGIEDPEWGEAVCAAVVLKPGREATAEEIVAFVQARLSSYKKPRHVVFMDALPRNPGRKVLKAEVAEHVRAAVAGGTAR